MEKWSVKEKGAKTGVIGERDRKSIFTRSNSTTLSSSHHFVPSSPSKHKSIHRNPSSSGSSHGKYCCSLSSNELPRPLPALPNFPSSSAASPSSATADFGFGSYPPTTQCLSLEEENAAELIHCLLLLFLILPTKSAVVGDTRAEDDGLPDEPRI